MNREPWSVAWVDQMMANISNRALKASIKMLKEQGLTIEPDSAAEDLIAVGVGMGAAETVAILLEKDLVKHVDSPV